MKPMGLLISCATPAASWPMDAIFSDCMSLSCASESLAFNCLSSSLARSSSCTRCSAVSAPEAAASGVCLSGPVEKEAIVFMPFTSRKQCVADNLVLLGNRVKNLHALRVGQCHPAPGVQRQQRHHVVLLVGKVQPVGGGGRKWRRPPPVQSASAPPPRHRHRHGPRRTSVFLPRA